jgi:hypothetical protein
MINRLFITVCILAIYICIAGTALSQEAPVTSSTTTTTTTVSKTVQNPDESYSVIEYPAGKQVVINLSPALSGASGTAAVIRQGTVSTINLNLAGLPADAGDLNVYAVDPTGAVTMLGPVTVKEGVASQVFTTPMNRFMLFVSPEQSLTTYTPETRVIFRGTVPSGFTVVPYAGGRHPEKAEGIRSRPEGYNVPMLGIPGFKKNNTARMRINFTGDLAGSHANAFIRPRTDGTTEVKVHFHDLKRSRSADERIIVWAVAPDNHFVKIGQAMSSGFRSETEIKGETSLPDFGLFITAETSDVESPSRTILGTFTIEK